MVTSAKPPAKSPGGTISPDLLERLGRLGVQIGADGIPSPADARERRAWSPGAHAGDHAGDQTMDRAIDRAPSPARLELASAVPGREADNALGRCWIAEVHRDGSSEHASEILDAARSASVGALAQIARDPRLEALEVERAVFIDTETTGLAGGTGTFAFLIGAGRFVDGVFRVRQFFMRDPTEEAAQLAELSAWLEGTEGIVTFNGRTFDLPLLDTRYVMNRMAAPWADPLHLDLLPPARRIWRRRLDSCSLTSLEACVLGMERQDDVPGWLVPQRYRRYQVEGDARPLVGIFRHNALDILSMVSLLTRVARAWSDPEAVLADAEDWLSLARAYEAEGRTTLALQACEGALRRGLSAASAEDAREQLALIRKRSGDWDSAVSIWSEMTQDAATRRLFPFEELSKYHEHRAQPRRLESALEVAIRALDLVNARTLRPKRGRFRAIIDLEHRIARLERRITDGDRAAGA